MVRGGKGEVRARSVLSRVMAAVAAINEILSCRGRVNWLGRWIWGLLGVRDHGWGKMGVVVVVFAYCSYRYAGVYMHTGVISDVQYVCACAHFFLSCLFLTRISHCQP